MKKHCLPQHDGQSCISTWNHIPAMSAVKRWVQEVALLNTGAFSADDWSIAGHAIVFEYNDFDAVGVLMPQIAKETGMHLVQIDREQICNFSEWLTSIPKDRPVLVYLEPGLWFKSGLSKDSSDHEWPDCPTHSDEAAHSFRIELAKFLRTDALSRPIIFITSAQSIGQMDIRLRQVDLFDRRIQLPELSYEDAARAFIDEVGGHLLDGSVTDQLTRVGCLVRHEFDDRRRRLVVQKALKRRCSRDKRQATYDDLVGFAVYGIWS